MPARAGYRTTRRIVDTDVGVDVKADAGVIAHVDVGARVYVYVSVVVDERSRRAAARGRRTERGGAAQSS